jgi:thioesterase domain-containing protein/acyl carrier protein
MRAGTKVKTTRKEGLPSANMRKTESIRERSMNSGLQRTHAADQVGNEIKALRKPNELLVWLQKESPASLAEDAFVVPLWFSQQRTWLEDPSNSNSAVCNYPLLLRIRGSLNEGALQQSLQEIGRRHHVLRSVFQMKDGELIQIVVPPEKLTLRLMDLRGCPEATREARAQRIALEEAHQPFDLSRKPLLRTALMRMGTDDHFLQLTSHDIVFDDWSTGILVFELSELYQAFAAGTASPLHDLAFQYGDYVRWQEEQLQGKVLGSKLSYWKQQLSSPAGFHHLATDFARPTRSTYRTAREHIELPTDLADSLKALSRQERVSLFMVLLAGFQCLLHRYSNHEEIGVASCGANRPLVEVEGLIGRFGNEMFLRTSLSGNPTFRELLVRVRETALNAYSDQDLPFGKLLKEFGADTNRNPLFQVMFFLQNAHQENRQVPGLTMSWFPFCTGTAKYDLNVGLKIQPALEVILEYSTDLFRAATMKQILDDYQQVLETMTQDPGARVSNLLISRKAEPAKVQPILTGTKEALEPKDSVAPKSDVQSRLVELWEAAFGIQPIGVDQDFFELGGDSLLAARLFTQIEKAFQIDLPLAALLEAPTIRQLAGTISGRKTRSSVSSLVVIQPSGTKPPLFCVHGHMGEVFYCRNLSRSLGADQPVFGLRFQDVGGESPRYTVEDMAVHYLREIRTVQPEGPYFLSGFCSGGMVAYEMARLLKIQGEDVALLVLFNAPAPGSLKGWPLNRGYLAKRIAHELKKLRTMGIREKLAVFGGKAVALARLVFGSFKVALWQALANSSIGRAEKGAQRLLSVADINIAAAKAYNPGAYPGRIILFLTKEVESLYAIDPRDGWMALAGDGLEIHGVAGDNNSMFDARFVDALAEKLKSCITRAHVHGWEAATKPQPCS